MNKIKILQINSRVNMGSASRITEQIGLLVKENGWESYIAYGRGALNSQSELIPIGSKIEVIYHYLISKFFDKEGLSSKNATSKLISKIKELQPDIIHLQNIHGHYLNYQLLFEYLNTIHTPIVWTLHDCWSFTGHCYHFVEDNCYKWKNECNNCPMSKSFLKIDRSLLNFNLKKNLFTSSKYLHIVTVSNWLRDFVKESYFRNNDIQVIKNGIDLSAFHPIQHQRNDRFIVLGVASVWQKSKGFDDFIELRKLLDDSYEIVMVGISKSQFKLLPKGIKGIQRTSSTKELAALYSSADVFVNLTYADTYPTVNLESQACGTPVITYRTGGSPESISPETGFIVEQGNLRQVVNAIEVIKEKGSESYFDACVNKAIAEFDRNDRFQEYIKLYKNLLS